MADNGMGLSSLLLLFLSVWCADCVSLAPPLSPPGEEKKGGKECSGKVQISLLKFSFSSCCSCACKVRSLFVPTVTRSEESPLGSSRQQTRLPTRAEGVQVIVVHPKQRSDRPISCERPDKYCPQVIDGQCVDGMLMLSPT